MEKQTAKSKTDREAMDNIRVNPLRNEKIYVRFVPRKSGMAGDNPKHPMWGSKADGTFDRYTVPVLRNTNNYKNPLTKDEMEYLEEALGLDVGALSVYKKENNYWDNYYVELTKEGLTLDLSDPEDYIKYAVLRANPDYIAPSMQDRIDRPKATYRYEMVKPNDETSLENAKMSALMTCYKEFGKIEDEQDILRVLIEILDSKPYAANETLAFLRARANILIQADPKKFLSTVTDPLLRSKVLIRRASEVGALVKRGDYYYLKQDNSPLCENGEDPTLSIAARYLNLPSHQDVKFILEEAVGKSKK